MSTGNNLKEKNLKYFQDNLQEFLKNPVYRHKYLVIHNEEVKGSFDTFAAALEDALAHCSQDEFVVQQVLDESEQINFLKSAV